MALSFDVDRSKTFRGANLSAVIRKMNLRAVILVGLLILYGFRPTEQTALFLGMGLGYLFGEKR